MKRNLLVGLLMTLLVSEPLPASADPTPPARLSWSDVSERVRQSNLDLKVAGYDLRTDQLQEAVALGQFRPTLSFTSQLIKQSSSLTQGLVPGGPTPQSTLPPNVAGFAAANTDTVFGQVGYLFPVYSGGRLQAQLAGARSGVTAGAAGLARTGQQTLFAARQEWLATVFTQETVGVAERSLREAEENLRVVEARYKAGAAAKFDTLQAEVAASSAEQDLVHAQTQFAQVEIQLLATMNLPLDQSVQLAEETGTRDLEEPAPAPQVSMLLEQARHDRPDLGQLQAQIDQAQADERVAQSALQPQVGAGVVMNAIGNGHVLNTGPSVTLSVSMTMADGGVTRARTEQARVKARQLQVQKTRLEQQIEADIRNSLLSTQQAETEMQSAEAQARSAVEAARVARVRFESGVGTSLELVTAQANLAHAEQTLAQSRYDWQLADAQLILARGGDL